MCWTTTAQRGWWRRCAGGSRRPSSPSPRVLERPLHGRALFEDVIRENLDLGRPDQVQLIFNRRVSKRTPTRYRTRVITQSVVPSSEKQPVRRSVGGVRSPFAAPDCVTCGYGVFGSLHVDYKHSRIKQYHKEGRAAHRDHHQRQLRLRRRQRAGQFRAAQEAGIYHQSTPVARPTPEPQLPDRRRGVRWPAAAASGARQRPTLHRIAFRLCTGASADGCVAGLPACCHGGSTAPRWRRRSALPWRLGQRDG